jgi:hypothetical protein
MRIRPACLLAILFPVSCLLRHAVAAPGEGAKPSKSPGTAYDFVPPDDAGVVDVVRDYGAKGDGVTDDTAAIQKAISEHLYTDSRILWLRNGTYLVSDRLTGLKPNGTPYQGMFLHGQCRDRTVIRLKEGCPGYQDPAKPKAVVKTCSREQLDGGNMGHWNYVVNLTVDTGKGNPGAVGVDYLCSNNGAMRDVTIRSGDGAGVMGIDMTKPWPGPCLLKNVHVVGFDYGIRLAHAIYSVTLEHVLVERQRVCGIRNDDQIFCGRGIRSLNAVPAIESTGMLVLLDSELRGAGSDKPAVRSTGCTYLRNVKADGYAGVIAGQGPVVAEYASRAPQGQFPSPPRSLCLPVEETPFVPYDPPELWAKAHGNSSSIQKAIDSGKPTVYVVGGGTLDKPVIIRGNVRRIFNVGGLNVTKDLEGKPAWRYEGTAHPAVVMEYGGYPTLAVEHASPKALVIRHCGLVQTNTPGCGPLFIEDLCSGPWVFDHPQKIWARHLNIECDAFDLKNNGATLWILGWKTERGGVQIETTKGGYTELLGGLVYPAGAVPQDRPMFVNHESNVALLVRLASFVPNGIHKVKVLETRDGETKQTERLDETLYLGVKTPFEVAAARVKAPPGWGGRGETRKDEKPDGASEGVGAPPKPAAPKPVADAAALALWDAKLKARLQEELKEERKPKFPFAMLGQECRFAAIDDKDAIRIMNGGSAMDLTWKALTTEDKRWLVMGLLREDRADDVALAAFYHLAAGDVEKGQAFLARAGGSGEAVRAAFRQ